ncbi:aquaporin-like [Macrosteles quadrilineatus]|uniref:aquaporin-like n=1 Tax=Macrosteles quadrilineatus TaxID=74068 RepID=UPI0023E22E68|nr:aquaporin-like [Macrosteles quadrilineatus]
MSRGGVGEVEGARGKGRRERGVGAEEGSAGDSAAMERAVAPWYRETSGRPEWLLLNCRPRYTAELKSAVLMQDNVICTDRHRLLLKDSSPIMELVRSAVAELIGTAVLLWLATSTCAQFPGNGSTLQTSLTVGTAVSVLVFALGHVSGCHINPAVTVAFTLSGRTSIVRAWLYILVQLLGAVAGTAVYIVTTPSALRGVGFCSTTVNQAKAVSWDQALVVESFLSGVLILVILAVTDKRLACPASSGPLIVGLAVVADFLMGLQYSGCSMNPARSFGPAILSGYSTNQWVD